MSTLRHVSIPASSRSWPPRFPTYELAELAQTKLQQHLLSWKAEASASASSGLKTVGPPPRPTLLSFTPAPTFTLGRRQSTQPLTPSDEAALRAPLISHGTSAHNSAQSASFQPVVSQAPRGGLATYHGPGQIVLWPVLDLRSPLLPRNLTVRDYACLLEKTTIATLKQLYALDGFTTENPGVWLRKRRGGSGDINPGSEEADGEDCKVAAMGVHLRRHVTGLGVAINYTTPVAGPAASNPWARIVPCGLGEKGVTSVEAELGFIPESCSGEEGTQDVAKAWAREFAARLGLQGGSGAAGAAGPVEDCSWDSLKAELDLDSHPLGETGYAEARIV